MRVLLMAQFFPPDFGGEERHVFNLANALAGRGHEVAVATQRMPDVPDEEVLATGVRVHRFSTLAMRLPGVYGTYRQHHPPIPDPVGVRELSRIVAQERPEIVHAHNWIVNSALAVRRRYRQVSDFGLVLTLHDYSHVCATKRFMRKGMLCEGPKFVRCLQCSSSHYGALVGPVTTAATFAMLPWKSRAIDHVVSVSHAVARSNEIPEGAKSSVIPNFIPDALLASREISAPVDCSSAAALPSGPFLLFVGDISREKGIEVLLSAYESLARDRPPLVLIGKRTADSPRELPDQVMVYLNWTHNDVMTAFRRCLIAILPSVWPDPCPTTVLEAMASGCAVISTSTGGIVDMVVSGHSGLLVAPGDADALASAITRLLTNGALRAQLAAGARRPRA